ncbi:tRNA uridine-5-carboxymethylaminomethyl(34) synthesis enzyme MnmG [Candidatus Synchoanobacter obligatus]|uniref:tRNA uridine 5-carboxymethylaminomethyl modification enzyme MnmG n=1 Tax=Candidatus Synchoanobacter obligatus TaxID=2919597 RepID=A0ABT1L4V7_9GAMM|nr:tRNA uridine-5-carboxymethylaminomethyl(34) synthesis enzyme MnmG [Candidatus Synchoanobacter obligatus]MCP8352210.1 tRNA uridine-5-carboxymethylaminomethyl(34) synthesis enzyme MnmG [Candidatus Synchoanobacter obligatus]
MYKYPKKFDVIVIGGGHAGVEAAGAAARMGMHTLLVTHNIDTIGVMSCNPAIGGLGKTHLVKEVDALDGYMGRAADAAAIHKRVLNASKGAAVQAVRYQACRDHYRQAIRQMVESTKGLEILQSEVADLMVDGDTVTGVQTKSQIDITAKAVVLTTGTFLAGKIHVGSVTQSGGRSGDPASEQLATYLGKTFAIGRLKTGTPPRIAQSSIDFSKLEIQASEHHAPQMSYMHDQPLDMPQRHCYMAKTNAKTHEIIKRYMAHSPIFQQRGELMGPRYCPSIEQKVDRFPEKDSHQIFVEPEGLYAREIYPNGISTSLPFEAQQLFIQSMVGFEEAIITRPGYAISYGYFDPRGLKPSLETKTISGLFFAGQINGTTGYEEAAAQGILAGINAALKVQEADPLIMGRDQSYIGVLVDDLVTNGTIEPYRMFTSRAEHRLKLRCDNAHYRLTALGAEVGVVSSERLAKTQKQERELSEALAFLQANRVTHYKSLKALYPNDGPKLLADLVKQPQVPVSDLIKAGVIQEASRFCFQEAITYLRYEGYIAKQEAQIKRLDSAHRTKIPTGFVYAEVKGLSAELVEKLLQVQPLTLGQASRISGMTPAALSLIAIYLKRHEAVL